MRNKIKDNILIACFLGLGVLYVIRFGGPAILRMYIEAGLGNCQKTPILCVKPQREVINPVINEKYLFGLPYSELDGIQICTPEEFKLIKQKIKKVYHYVEKMPRFADSTIYLLYEPPNFFVNLFHQSKKYGINTDYDFIGRVMNVNLNEINNIPGAFFAIMKGIFTPNLGDQKNVKIVKITSREFKGFISYNFGITENYFDCNIFDNKNNYFKVYIKDLEKMLDMNKVLAIISSIKRVDSPLEN